MDNNSHLIYKIQKYKDKLSKNIDHAKENLYKRKLDRYKKSIQTSHRNANIKNCIFNNIEDKLEPKFVGTRTVKICTYNIWGVEKFSKYSKLDKRLPHITDIIIKNEPDIVCLQEMSHITLKYFMSKPYIANNYYFSEIKPDLRIDGKIKSTITPIILTKIKPLSITRYLLETTEFGYPILVAEYPEFIVVNCHLQAGGKPYYKIDKDIDSFTTCRIKQIKSIKDILDKHNYKNKKTILTGDLNFDVDVEIESNTLSQLNLQDAWITLHKNKKGYTEDTTINSMRWNVTHRKKTVRYDVVLYKDVTPLQIKLIGDKPVFDIDIKDNDFREYAKNRNRDMNKMKTLNNKLQYWPSDHFGLICTFEYKN